MKILVIHNCYKTQGSGEDHVFYNESELLKKNGQNVETLEFHTSDIKSPFDLLKSALLCAFNFESQRIISQKIKTFRPDIIHVHNFFPLISPAIFWIAKRQKIPIVFTIHNYRLVCASGYLFRKDQICELCLKKRLPLAGIFYRCYKNSIIGSLTVTLMSSIHKFLNTWNSKVDRYIVLTEFAKQLFMNSSVKLQSEKISVKPNFSFDKGCNTDQKDDYVLFVGRICLEKGIPTLLQGFEGKSIKLKIIGTGPLSNMAENYASKSQNIEYLGPQSLNFIFDAMKKAKAVIVPSQWYEGLPLVIVEAFSTGTPVIASNIGNVSKLIEDGVNGFHFQFNSPIDLYQKTEKLLNNSETCQLLSKNARETYTQNYTPEKNYSELIKIYTATLESYRNS